MIDSKNIPKTNEIQRKNKILEGVIKQARANKFFRGKGKPPMERSEPQKKFDWRALS